MCGVRPHTRQDGRNRHKKQEDMTFTLKNTTDLSVIYSASVTDKETSEQFYVFDITLPSGIPDGEYEYSLTDDDVVLSSGLVTIKGNASVPTEYNQDITYEQYES